MIDECLNFYIVNKLANARLGMERLQVVCVPMTSPAAMYLSAVPHPHAQGLILEAFTTPGRGICAYKRHDL